MNRVREVRERAGLSQTRLACLVGVAQGVLCNIELGYVRPWPKLRRLIAEALQVDEQELFPDCQQPVGASRNGN